MKPKKTRPMNTEANKTVFLQTVVVALGNLKRQLQHDYEQAYPDLREIIHLVLDEEESRAWDLTFFPIWSKPISQVSICIGWRQNMRASSHHVIPKCKPTGPRSLYVDS